MTDDRMTMDARAEAVEAMREAIHATDNGIDQTSYAELATAALDALLSSGLVVLMGEMDKREDQWRRWARRVRPSVTTPPSPAELDEIRLRSREEEGT